MSNIDQWRDELMSRLQKNEEWDSWLENFLESLTDANRINAVYELPFTDEVITIDIPESSKCPDDSTEMRMMGNDEFKQKNYAEAFDYFTQSILKAPAGSEELALAYANRSAVTKEEKKYDNCLKDIDLALSHGYPAKLKHKILERQGRCYYELGLYENAAESFEKAIFKLTKSGLKKQEMETREKKLNALLERCQNKTNLAEKLSKGPNYTEPIPEITNIKSEQFPCASDLFSLEHTPESGRYLVAKEDIKIGEVLVVEEPYCSVVNSKYLTSHCHFCCQRAEVPVPCIECSNVVYCSLKCQEASWNTYHSIECPILPLVSELDSDIAHLALRMVIKATFKYLKEFKETHEDSNNEEEEDPCLIGFNENGVYDSHNYWAVYNLVNHTYDRKFPDLFRRTVMAVYLLKCLEKTKYFPSEEECSKSNRIEIGGHILRHLQMLPCNAHEVTEFLIEPGKLLTSDSIGIGSAIYATLSLFNHSCDPNVVRHSYGDKCVVRAIHKIKKGEEIVDSYSIIYPTMDKEKRKSELRRQYYFQCECEACEKDWPMYEELMNRPPSFKCDKCDMAIGCLEGEEEQSNDCENCGHSNHLAKKVQNIISYESDFNTVFNNALSADITKEDFSFLLEHQTRLENWMSRPWQDINKCQEVIKQYYSFQANHFTVNKKKDLNVD